MAKDVLAEHLEKGWIHARLYFEVLGADPEVAKKSLKDHLSTVKKMDKIKIVSERYEEVEKLAEPPKKFKGKEAYSQFVEVEAVVSSVENLLYAVVFFGPSSVEIIGPKEMKIKLEEAQSMANAMAEVMHRYAAAGAGGIVINTKR